MRRLFVWLVMILSYMVVAHKFSVACVVRDVKARAFGCGHTWLQAQEESLLLVAPATKSAVIARSCSIARSCTLGVARPPARTQLRSHLLVRSWLGTDRSCTLT